jgi:hypothetical protein
LEIKITSGRLKIVDSTKETETVFLYTYHSAMDVPQWVKHVPSLLASKRSYLKNREEAKDALNWDETLLDWFFCTNLLSAAVIAYRPFTLMPVSSSYNKKYLDKEEFYYDYLLTINIRNKSWVLENVSKEEIDEFEFRREELNPSQLFINSFPE